MEIADANEVVTATEWADAVEVISPRRLRVATLDELPGVTPAMLGWWFAHMDRAGYMSFHPIDHEEFAWVRGKQPGRFVGATHLTHQRYGGTGPLMRAEISFIPVTEHLDPATFEQHGVGFALCAVIHLLDAEGRPEPEEAGRFVHVGIARDYGTELRNCWWLNTDERSDLERMTTARFRHVHEEFGYLADFLPGLYATSR
jgi:DAPG hydrolase PhiG domain